MRSAWQAGGHLRSKASATKRSSRELQKIVAVKRPVAVNYSSSGRWQ
ncbi:hypothetical protein IIA15_02690 [candidate division TA06 bacterium]|nr:hypothetical protein [candidate division TA06 bacterium]